MPKRYGKANSKKIKRRAPIRQEFFELFVKDDSKVHAVQFSHQDNVDILLVSVDKNFFGSLPSEFKGYAVVVRTGRAN